MDAPPSIVVELSSVINEECQLRAWLPRDELSYIIYVVLYVMSSDSVSLPKCYLHLLFTSIIYTVFGWLNHISNSPRLHWESSACRFLRMLVHGSSRGMKYLSCHRPSNISTRMHTTRVPSGECFPGALTPGRKEHISSMCCGLVRRYCSSSIAALF